MVIDDEEFCIAAMQAMLGLLGIDTAHQVDFCINGKEAIKIVTDSYKKGFKYNMIFTDFQMPIMDGTTATKKIRQVLKEKFDVNIEDQPAIIGVTGHVDERFKADGI